MSYFDGSETGQAAVFWAGANSIFMYAQTPAVHDILAVQQVYGADYTTRAGDTVYGFNSTADRGVFDFTTNKAPIVTIWDGGGNDTLDFSGFDANNIIDINEGAFSSAGLQDRCGYAGRISVSGPMRKCSRSPLTTALVPTAVRSTISPSLMAHRSKMRSAVRATIC